MDKYFVSIDIGQQADYTALSILEKTGGPDLGPLKAGYRPPGPPPPPPPVTYQLRHLERFPLRTPYPAVAERVRDLLKAETLASAWTRVIVDVTGVGRPVFDMLDEALRSRAFLHGILIHGGDAVVPAGRILRVPKRDLVSVTQVLLQSRRLRFAKDLRLADVLRHELQTFKAKINLSTGHDTYEAWREGDHDDLVLSLAMACWFAEKRDWDEPPLRASFSVRTI